MTVAIDYDRTWTLDPDGWALIAGILLGRGHTVVMATARFDTPCNQDELRQYVPHAIPAHFCGGLGLKREVLRSRGVHVDVWVDDDPFSIDDHRRYEIKASLEEPEPC